MSKWARSYDGMITSTATTGDEKPKLYRVFCPKWWQLGRWIEWLRAKEKGTMTLSLAAGDVTVRMIRYFPPKH
jgi:hypothetical protein